MRSRSLLLRAGMLLAPAILVVGAVACGGDDDKKTSSASGGATGGGAAVSTATIVAMDNVFNPTDLTVKAGQEVTLTLDNKGQAVHNWHVLNVKGKDGKDVTTTLLNGGKQETIKFTFDKAGTFDLQCDVHPAEMKGKITVQ